MIDCFIIYLISIIITLLICLINYEGMLEAAKLHGVPENQADSEVMSLIAICAIMSPLFLLFILTLPFRGNQ